MPDGLKEHPAKQPYGVMFVRVIGKEILCIN